MYKLLKGNENSIETKLNELECEVIGFHISADGSNFAALIKTEGKVVMGVDLANPQLEEENKILKDQLADAHNAEAAAKKDCTDAIDRCKILTIENTKLQEQLNSEREKYGKEIEKLKQTVQKLTA